MSARDSSLRRAFLAVVPPADVRAALDAALEPVRAAAPPRLSWSRSTQWHVTLQFLGPVTDADAVVASVRDAVRGVRVFGVGIGGTGAFPTPARASVVWVGLDDGREELAGLAARVGAATAGLGYPADPRPFSAHLSVARARRPCPVASVLAAMGDGPFGRAWDVREVVLFESDTRPSGAVHREHAVVQLRDT